MKTLKQIITAIMVVAVSATFLSGKRVKNIDSGVVAISVKNNQANVLTFPFLIKNVQLISNRSDAFTVKVKGNSITLVPKAESKDIKADLVILSRDNYSYLVKINLRGLDEFWEFTSNRVKPFTRSSLKFETGNVDSDVKKLISMVENKHNIPGYKKTEVHRKFYSGNLTMEKAWLYDGSRYRVEEWYLQNTSRHPITLDEGSFYTKGILAISFEKRHLAPYEIVKMYMIVNKSSLEEVLNRTDLSYN